MNVNIEESVRKFNEFPSVVVFTIDNGKVAKKLGDIGTKHEVSLYPLLIFVCTGDVSEDAIPTYLSEVQGKSKMAIDRIVPEFKKEVLDVLVRRLNFLNQDPDKEMTQKQEKQYLREMFENHLTEEFTNHEVIIEAVNDRIFSIFASELNFKNELEKILYENNEKLTTKKFILDGKVVEPTIKNWLKYFIEKRGTEMIDSINMSVFVSQSENSKILDEDEKRFLFKLLTLYRNLKFFPQSMPSDDGEGWEIIPTEKKEEVSKAAQLSREKKTGTQEVVEQLGGDVSDYPEGSLEREILEEEDEKEKEYQKLLLLSNKYEEGSLERRAIEEEIKKIKN